LKLGRQGLDCLEFPALTPNPTKSGIETFFGPAHGFCAVLSLTPNPTKSGIETWFDLEAHHLPASALTPNPTKSGIETSSKSNSS